MKTQAQNRRVIFNDSYILAKSKQYRFFSMLRQYNTSKIRAKRKRIVFQRQFQKPSMKTNWLDTHYNKLAYRFGDPSWLQG